MSSTRVAISACLLGERVRYDGADRGDADLVAFLSQHAELVPVCPEVELGLGVPRPPMQLVGDESSIRLVVIESGQDLTAEMDDFSTARVRALLDAGISGYVFKSKSPSCGLRGVGLFAGRGDALAAASARGRFAEILLSQAPELPVCEERDLEDDEGRDRFVAAIERYAGGSA